MFIIVLQLRQNIKCIYKKCGADFRLSYQIMWKDLSQMSMRKSELLHAIHLVWEIAMISTKDLRKTLSQYVMPNGITA